ncbi:MAG: zinc-binding dehydrogenase [Acidobacteria bacterium]|nr:zinc-binding dehydrogenase [Acidobacteriota bacterium]MCI0623180.1 zinc-binding dehydrogenase [Acidobacteriota bacterium]MCI0721388.1 zinc-binding dehydrogenase [Acidobacteriota bacterium]
MKAVVKTGPDEGQLALKDWPEPSPGPNQVKLRIGAAGICGTDIHIIKGRWRCDPPVVLGHEFCGTVVEVGPQVRGFKPGDRVVASNPAIVCGNCYHCLAGNPFMCKERVSAGYMIDGAFAEFLCIRPEVCHHLPDHVSFRAAAMGEPLAVAVRAVMERSTVHAGDLVVVSGPGCVGLLTLLMAKLEGARVIISGVGTDLLRLKCGKDLGADRVVNTSEEDLLEVVRDYSGGHGADLVYECSGSARSLGVCWEAVRKEGTVVQVGVYPGPIETDLNKVMMKELRFIGTYGYVWTSWKRAVQLWDEKKIQIDSMVSHEYPLSQFEEAFRATQDGSAIKVVLNPESS